MRVCVLSANLGGYDPPVPWADQVVPDGVTVEVVRLTDESFPPRPLAMTSRLQCGIPKMFGWQLRPGFDVYIWIDASRGLLRPDSVAWFLERAGDFPLMLFKHPKRDTIRQEYEFVRDKLAAGNRYLSSRYAGEWLTEQYAAVTRDPSFVDDRLYASTAFLYRPIPAVRAMLTAWWGHKSRYLLHDQLALPFVVWQSGVIPRVLTESVYDCPYFPITR